MAWTKFFSRNFSGRKWNEDLLDCLKMFMESVCFSPLVLGSLTMKFSYVFCYMEDRVTSKEEKVGIVPYATNCPS